MSFHTRLLAMNGSAKPRQVVGKLPPPPWPVVRDVVTPKVDLMWDAFLGEHPAKSLCAYESASCVFPHPLSAHQKQEHAGTQPVQVVAVHVGHIVQRSVEVHCVAALAPAIQGAEVVDSGHAQRLRKEIGPFQGEVRGVIGTETGACRKDIRGPLTVGKYPWHNLIDDPRLILPVA